MIRLTLVMLFCGSIMLVYGQNKSSTYTIDTLMFANNAHHWYDIKDKHNVINPKKNQPRYKASDIQEVGNNILLYQKENGGWAKNYDIMAILTPAQKDSVAHDQANLNTTFDNGTTYTHITCLAKIYQATKNKAYSEAAINGLQFILNAQYDNGGWPQYFPLQKDYSRHITYNDDVFTGIMTLLKSITDNEPAFKFVTNGLRKKIETAYKKGIECVLNTQINDFGEITAWCQQHDEVTLQPTWARAFEPPSICNAESAGVVLMLMDIDHPSERIVEAVQKAVAWFKESKIEGIRVNVIPATPDTSQYTISKIDRVVVEDKMAPPIWARFYELQTHRPLFCNRDKKVVYSLKEISRERRSGYGWYTYNPQKVLDRYTEWAKKWVSTN